MSKRIVTIATRVWEGERPSDIVEELGIAPVPLGSRRYLRQRVSFYQVMWLCLMVPGIVLAQGVDIPDPNLRAAISEALNKAPGDAITRAEMKTLSRFHARRIGITDLHGIEFAINLTWLSVFSQTFNYSISDISPLANLTNLRFLNLGNNTISDISPLANLTNLRTLDLRNNTMRNKTIRNTISDISPLANLTNLRFLNLGRNSISDISPLANLTNLRFLNLGRNTISDISPLANLTNLRFLNLRNNTISDIETLERFIAQGTVVYFWDNPAFESPGPKIEDGWIWLIVPATNVHHGTDAVFSGRDFLSEASGGAATEADVAVNGASAGTRVGNSVWTAAPLKAAKRDNLNAIVSGYNLGTDIDFPVAYGMVSIQSETLQETRLYIGADAVKVWLNGTIVYRDTGHSPRGNYKTAVPVMLMPGENLLFIATCRQGPRSVWCAFFGFQDGTVYTPGGAW